jgi:predicted ATPase
VSALEWEIVMVIEELRVAGYRSVRDLTLPLGRINVLVGPNGCGKTNLYRALYLLSRAAAGQVAAALAEEGGMPSVLWAGERNRNEKARMTLAVQLDALAYEIVCGLPIPSLQPNREPSTFCLDPQVKEERVWFLEKKRRVVLLERDHTSASARNAEGVRVSYRLALSESESVLSQLREPEQFPALSALCREFLSWRFYHRFRTDAEAPLRHPQIGVRTFVLDHDGRDLAATLQTIVENGHGPDLDAAVDRAFPGAVLRIFSERGRFHIGLEMPGFQRAFDGRELSDGTLHYLCLLAALLTPRPPSMLALNEPEASIHPDLLEPLAELIVQAGRESQLWITTHSQLLADHVHRLCGARPVCLDKVDGRTVVKQPKRGDADYTEKDR